MNALPPVNLADAFTKPSGGLTGVLPARPKKPADSKPVIKTGGEAAAERPAPKRTRTRPAAKPASQRVRGVIVYVTPEQRDWIRSQTTSNRATTDVVLEAIENHQTRLTPPPLPTPAVPASDGALFPRQPKPERHDGVQLQLRMTQPAIDILDTIVTDHRWPSRSALIRAALTAAATHPGSN